MSTQKNDDSAPVTAYENYHPQRQEQKLPGLDSAMEPLASHTKVEKWDNEGKPYLEEYKGTGKLQGKAAIVTGGDSGIGRSVALAYLREGANVSIAFLPAEREDAEEVARLARANPTGVKEVNLIECDLRKRESCKQVVDEHMKKYGHLEILVNNASMQVACEDFEQIDLDVTEDTFKTNIVGMIAMVKFALPHMKRGSSIIQTSSVTAYKGSKGMVDYSSTKGAIISLTRSLALQISGSRGIRVNAVAPGPVYTPLQPASRDADNMEGWAVGQLAFPARPGQPAEMAAAYVFLADSACSNLMTGQVLHLNNGSYFC